MSAAIWEVKVNDDVSATAKAMAASVENLTKDVRMLGNAFKAADTGSLVVGMKEANALFHAARGNVKLFRAALKDAGVSAVDAGLLVGKMTKELRDHRAAALGLGGGFWGKIFDPHFIWVFSHALNIASKGISAIKAVGGPVLSGLQFTAGKIAEGGTSMITRVIDAAQFRQNSLVAIASEMEGTEEERMRQARELFKYAQKTAKETPLDTKDVIAGIRDLKVAKYTTAESKLLYRLVADQASKHLSEPGYDKKVIDAFARVKGRGVATGEDLESMRVAGFNAKEIVMALADKHPDLLPGAKGKFKVSEEQGIKYVKEVLGKGQISSTTFVNAVIAAAEKGKPDIGEIAKQLGGKSLTGAISNAKAAFDDLISSTDIVEWPGIQALIGFLNKVSSALDGDTESGRKLLDVVRSATNSIFEGLGRITSGDIEKFVETLGRGIRYVADTLERAWGWFSQILTGQKSLGEGVEEMLIDVGVLIGEGIRTGFTSVFGEGRKDRRIREETGLNAAQLSVYAATSGKTPEEFRAEFGAQYAAFKAQGNKVPEAKWWQSQEALTVETVKAWAEKSASSVESAAVIAARSAEQLKTLADNGSALQTMSVPKMADGGIVTSPTLAIVGEAGPEAVVPLGSDWGGGSYGPLSALKSFGGGSPGPVSISVTVNGGGDPDAIRDAVVPPIVAELTRIFRRAVAEG